MLHPKELRIEDFRYELPEELVARFPLAERDQSKLLVYKDKQITEDRYRHLHQHIPPGSLMVFNQTRVVHARLLFQKPTGGVIEIFCLEPHEKYGDLQVAMQHTGSVWWKCMIGGASKWKHGQVLSLEDTAGGLLLTAAIVERGAGSFTIEFNWQPQERSFAEVLSAIGKVPLPPYLHREADPADTERYQTLYARDQGSVAAPTAGLHFTPAVMDSLKARGVSIDFATLHVGAGTFKPVKSETMEGHEMHAEWIQVSPDNIDNLLAHLDKDIVAVGTTSLRTLESLYWIGRKLHAGLMPDLSGISVEQWDPYELDLPDCTAGEALSALRQYLSGTGNRQLLTRTRIIIAPGYRFRIVSGLVTNFHQPESTLLLLVAAFTDGEWHKVYDYALQHHFRFLSYGDGSLLWRTKPDNQTNTSI